MSTSTKIIIIVAILAVGSFGGYLFFSGSNDNTSPVKTSSEATTEETAVETVTSFTAQEVALKNSKDECWTIIDGAVYDITSYIPRHPGGDEVLLACGTDGSTLFNERKTSDGETIGSGTPHSRGATNQLDNYFIGSLED